MSTRRVQVSIIVSIVLFLCASVISYWWWFSLPKQIRIAAGPKGGRYFEVANGLKAAIKDEYRIHAEIVESNGSLENLRLLKRHEVDFAFFQAETREETNARTQQAIAELKSPEFIANLYSEVCHILVRSILNVESSSDFLGRTIAVGQSASGGLATSKRLLRHLGIESDQFVARQFDYGQIKDGFADQSLDIAIITAGPDAPILTELLGSGRVRLVPIPFADAFVAHHFSFANHTIPKGFYRVAEPIVPDRNVETVKIHAQLLTRHDISSELVERVTRIVLKEQFMKEQGLKELFDQGAEFATKKPEFSIHRGATHYYEPDLRPLLNADFVEAVEGTRSFVVSLFIAIFLLYRWFRRLRIKTKEHRLDRFIQSLLDIECRQLELDENTNTLDEDIRKLQYLLDEVTSLRQEALRDLTAHELNEDRAAGDFLEMCHALSDKIGAKLTRQRFDRKMSQLIGIVQSENTD